MYGYWVFNSYSFTVSSLAFGITAGIGAALAFGSIIYLETKEGLSSKKLSVNSIN